MKPHAHCLTMTSRDQVALANTTTNLPCKKYKNLDLPHLMGMMTGIAANLSARPVGMGGLLQKSGQAA